MKIKRHKNDLPDGLDLGPMLAKALERLRDLRTAAKRDGFETAYDKMLALRAALKD